MFVIRNIWLLLEKLQETVILSFKLIIQDIGPLLMQQMNPAALQRVVVKNLNALCFHKTIAVVETNSFYLNLNLAGV